MLRFGRRGLETRRFSEVGYQCVLDVGLQRLDIWQKSRQLCPGASVVGIILLQSEHRNLSCIIFNLRNRKSRVWPRDLRDQFFVEQSLK